jgi:hypothetical protein
MNESREKEWEELEAKAKQILENPRMLPEDFTAKHFTPVLHVWIAQTFTPETHWVFCKPLPQLNPQPKPIVKEIIWEQQKDSSRLHNPLVGLKEGFHTEPTIKLKKVEIEKDVLKNILDQLSKIQIPPFIEDEFLGRDGITFGVETLGIYQNAKIKWWSVYPDDWKYLAAWFEKTMTFLKEIFKDI